MISYKYIATVENPKLAKPRSPIKLFWLLLCILGLCASCILYSYVYFKLHHSRHESDITSFYKHDSLSQFLDINRPVDTNEKQVYTVVDDFPVDANESQVYTVVDDFPVDTNENQVYTVDDESRNSRSRGDPVEEADYNHLPDKEKKIFDQIRAKIKANIAKESDAQDKKRAPGKLPQLGDTPVVDTTIVHNKHFKSNVAEKAQSNAKGSDSSQSLANYGTCARQTKDEERFDCFPGNSPSEKSCTARGCCWQVADNSKVPACFYPHGFETYRIVRIEKSPHVLEVYWKNLVPSPYGNDVKLLRMSVKFETLQRLHVKITDANETRFEPSLPEVPLVNNRVKASDCLYDLITSENQTGFAVVRRSDQSLIFDSRSLGGFFYANQFLQISARLPSTYLYGLGEHRNAFLLDSAWSTLAFWALDDPPADNQNGYGTHPFLLGMDNATGTSYGIYLKTCNALEIVLQPTPAITYRSVGGILDFYFFLGPTPSDVVAQYLDVVGLPELPPYWSLGFHLCRWGYDSLTELQAVIERNVKAGIPLDTVWVDIDYMERHNNFVLSPDFHGLKEYVQKLHTEGRHFIPIVDPGIASREGPTYLPYVDGVKRGVFVKNASGMPLEGRVWNDKSGTVYPDFSNPETVDYWLDQLKTLHDQFEYDGIWIDMNEPSNFVPGSLQGCPTNSTYEHPPYTPLVSQRSLVYKTLCMESIHSGGIHYNLHNMYGAMEAVATNVALKEIRNKRSLIISRSTYSGQGKYSGHWTGDVYSSYGDMKQSVADLMSFNIFGMPMVGADICGFGGDADAGLCQRWLQLGAFYPFSRNHNTKGAKPQDPAFFSDDIKASTIAAYRIRYSLLPYLYSLFYRATLYGETVVRPCLFEFPGDHNTYSLDSQFLWGAGLLVSPVLEKDKTYTETYLPAGVWYDYHNHVRIKSAGQPYVIRAPNSTIPLFLRGGYVLPAQTPDVTTTLSRKNPFHLLVPLNQSGQAAGILYWDDGESLNAWEQKKVTVVEFKAANQSLSSNVQHAGYTSEPMKLANVTLLGVTKNVTKVTVDGKEHVKFNILSEVLTVQDLTVDLTKPFSVSWT